MSILNEIGLRAGTDKASEIHNYLFKYEKYIPYKRYQPIRILEIGVLDGQSLRMWGDYFYNSNVIGIDINPECRKHEKDRIFVETGSQTDPIFLDRVIERYGPFDLIIDDGSHMNPHVIFSFQHLFPHVKPKGTYIVEDVCTSYWSEYGGKLRQEGSMVEYFKNVIDEVNYFGEYLEGHQHIHARRDDLLDQQFKIKGYNHIGTSIESISFMNSIILINKK